MLRLLAILLLLPFAAAAQDYPFDLDSTLVDGQASTEGVASFGFASPNSTRKGLRSLTVRSSAAGFAYLFDAASLPANGAVVPCGGPATARPCYLWCVPVAANGYVSASWDSPLKFTTGIIAAYSSTGCATLTTAAGQFFGQAP